MEQCVGTGRKEGKREWGTNPPICTLPAAAVPDILLVLDVIGTLEFCDK